MSLISDPDFIIHYLRLGYLRNVDDPYGPRLISLSPSYASNPYILAASLADVDRWPELTMPSSPTPSDDEGGGSARTASGLSGSTGLKYTTTIMGPSRTGAYGLRVSGSRRLSTDVASVRHSLKLSRRRKGVLQSDDEDEATLNGPAANVTPMPRSPNPISEDEGEKRDRNGVVERRKGEDSRTGDESEKESSRSRPPAQPQSQPKTLGFIPKFKGAAEMEARRRLRLMAHQPHNPADIRVAVPTPTWNNLNPEDSSSENEADGEGDDVLQDDDDDGFDSAPAVDDSMDIGDEFDPEFAATRMGGATLDSESDMVSVLSPSNSITSTSNPSILASSSNFRMRSRLSPVSENRAKEEDGTNDRTNLSSKVGGSYFLVNSATQSSESRSHDPPPRSPMGSTLRPDPSTPEMSFPRRKVPPIRPAKSALTAMLASTSSSTNPFTEFYAAISGRAETESMNVAVFFPRAKKPAGQVMDLNVRKDSSVEEVLGFALWNYWEQGCLPKLDEGLTGEDDPRWHIILSAVGWILRIAEDDGEVDEDFPPPDRTGRISKFNFDAYAVLEATPAQVQQNKILESKIQRRPSRIMGKKKKQDGGFLSAGVPVLAPGTSAAGSSLGMSPAFPGFIPGSLASSTHGPQLFLRIRVAETADAVHISTTIPVTAGMYMQEVLESVCRKRKLNSNEYALLVMDMSILIPLDRTVASLEGKSELVLVKRSMLPRYGIDAEKSRARTTDPNASIFKRMSEPPEVQYSSAMDYTGAYKKYVIFRRLPVLVGRHERILAIDGVYIHIMPSANKAKAVFDSGRTASYNIRSVVACQQSAKSSSTFKLVVHRDGGTKRYDFEAESPKLANEIVQSVKSIKAALERYGTVNKSRRSKHVG